MKKTKLMLLPAILMMAFTSCGKDKSAGKYKITFWGWGDEDEITVYRNLVKLYNATNTDGIYVEYNVKPSDSYIDAMEQVLGTKRAPDVFYVGDGDLKRWATYGWLEDISNYVASSTVIDLNDIWGEGISRYRYNVTTKTSNPNDPLYCLPKDIGPTVIYYNADAFRAVGITIISKADELCTEAERHGFNKETMTFNNRISMTVEEELELAKLLTNSINPSSPTTYGFYTEWWFNYVWSVGGDCLGKDEEGHYKWTLGDTTPHGDLPSNREMFKHFIDLSVVHHVSPNPNSIGDGGKTTLFHKQRAAMLVGLRAHVPLFRRKCNFDWDVAPLSHVAGGELAGHSGSMGFGIPSSIDNSRKGMAFKFLEYLAGPTGQQATAEAGFNLPNQISLANSSAFLQQDKKPANSVVFIEAATYQHVGDWGYLKDKLWIDPWAGELNGNVLNGVTSLDQFFAMYQDVTDEYLRTHY